MYQIIKGLNRFTDDQITRLFKLQYLSGKLLLDDDSTYLYEYLYLYDIYDFDELYHESSLTINTASTFKQFLRKLSIFKAAREQLQIEIENIRNKVEVVDGAYICASCSSPKTISHSALRASADEAATVFIVCVACGHKWHIKG